MCADRTAGARNRGEQGAGGADRREGCRSCRVATVPALRHGGYRQAWPGREWSAAVSLPVAAWLRSHLQRADEYAACTNAQARGLASLCRGTRRAAVTRLGSCASGHRPPDRLAVATPASNSLGQRPGADAFGHRRGRRRILLFSQFTSMLDLIKPELDRARIPFVELRGDTGDRVMPVARFQEGTVPLFLISLKAGGTGLNLTAADTVIHYDPWWNPAVETQATDRAHRIGQDKPVFVYKLIALGTVEQRILELQERKRALAGVVFDLKSGGAAGFDQADLELLFRPLG